MTSSPTLLAQLTELHIQVGPGDGDAARALAAAVCAVGALRPAPDAVVVTGDVAESGAAREYERARELLAPLPMPVHAIPGNHDDPDELSAVTDRMGRRWASDRSGSSRWTARDPATMTARLAPDRLAWLGEQLAVVTTAA